MGTLSGTLSLLTNALEVDQTALQVTSNNVANANTPGYSREVVNLAAQAAYSVGPMSVGAGVTIQNIRGIRDSVLDQRLNQEAQSQGRLNAYVEQMSQVQASLNDTAGSGLGAQFNDFFAKLQQLSVNPADIPSRQSLLSSANNLTDAINSVARGLAQQRSTTDSAVVQNVQEVNGLTTQIATLNGQIATATGLGQDTNALQDQRGQLLSQLSNLIDIDTISTNNTSLTVTAANGAALVVGSQSTPLTTQVGSDGVNHIFSGTQDITTYISGGQLAGLVDARDKGIPGIQQQLNSMTQSFVTAFNTQHQAGFDLNGTAGGAFFAIGNSTKPAESVSVAITDPSRVAASSDATAGNNANALVLANLQTQAISGSQSVMDMYTGAVTTLGNEVSTATNEQNAGQLVLTQIQNQRSSYSGVNLDEESINMSRFQQAYQAAAQVLSVINSLTSTTIDMVKN